MSIAIVSIPVSIAVVFDMIVALTQITPLSDHSDYRTRCIVYEKTASARLKGMATDSLMLSQRRLATKQSAFWRERKGISIGTSSPATH